MTAPAAGSHRLPILTYHSLDTSGSLISVSPSAFAAQMSALAALGLRGIALRDAVAFREAHRTWPRDAFVLTFDDGYANFFDDALPVLRRHGFSATVFVVSGHIGGANDWAPPPPGLGPRAMLSTTQVRELAAAGVEIGAHTRTHLNLMKATPSQIDDELLGSRGDLEQHVGQPVQSFAYPYGILSDAAVHACRRSFSAACTTELARAGGEDLHVLPRLDMYYFRSPAFLARAVAGRLDWYLTLRRWGRALRGFGGLDGSPD